MTFPRLSTRVVEVAALAGLVALGVHSFTGAGSPELFDVWLYEALEALAAVAATVAAVRRRSDRAAWGWIAAGLGLWLAGDVYYDRVLAMRDTLPFPSVADGLYIGFYVCMYIGIVLLLRRRVAHFYVSQWLDGAIAGLAVAAAGAAVLLPTAMASLDGSAVTVAWSLAYPLADLLLTVLVVGMCALAGWRPGRAWTLLGVGLGVSALADAVNVFEAAGGAPVLQSAVSVIWPAGMLLIAQAARSQDAKRRIVTLEGWRTFIVPAVFGVVALGMMALGAVGRVTPGAALLAGGALLGIIVRAAVSLHEEARLLRTVRAQASGDPLTGLGNRRRLMRDLHDLDAAGTDHVLLMFDLDGFKGYNDAFGHPAGDALLVRLAERLEAAVAPSGAAYRLGGDEFCVLAPGGADVVHDLVDRTTEALTESGEGFRVTTSVGAVLLPEEATGATAALGMADERLYRQKHAKHRDRGRRAPADLVLEALHSLDPSLRDQGGRVADLAARLGVRLGLDQLDQGRLRRAAELHDIGKIALPEQITTGDQALGDSEWRMVREHPAIGQRLLLVTPELRDVATLVRSTHERWDGRGYPDALAGEAIPVAARIIAVCDAYDAMVVGRPHRTAVPHSEALAELRRCAGTQFDPAVVEAFSAEAGADGAGIASAAERSATPSCPV